MPLHSLTFYRFPPPTLEAAAFTELSAAARRWAMQCDEPKKMEGSDGAQNCGGAEEEEEEEDEEEAAFRYNIVAGAIAISE